MPPARALLVGLVTPPRQRFAPAPAELPHAPAAPRGFEQQRRYSGGSPASQHALLTGGRWRERVWEEEEGRWQPYMLQTFWCISAKLLKQIRLLRPGKDAVLISVKKNKLKYCLLVGLPEDSACSATLSQPLLKRVLFPGAPCLLSLAEEADETTACRLAREGQNPHLFSTWGQLGLRRLLFVPLFV